LTTFKQFEFKSPNLIKERVDRDYHTILRTALTTISKVNKTDVETLRTSFNSFANISKVTTDQLQRLPGFGQVKVKNLKNAFEKPFRNQTTAPISVSQTHNNPGESSTVHHDQPVGQLAREPSPIWDIELDEGELLGDNIR